MKEIRIPGEPRSSGVSAQNSASRRYSTKSRSKVQVFVQLTFTYQGRPEGTNTSKLVHKGERDKTLGKGEEEKREHVDEMEQDEVLEDFMLEEEEEEEEGEQVERQQEVESSSPSPPSSSKQGKPPAKISDVENYPIAKLFSEAGSNNTREVRLLFMRRTKTTDIRYKFSWPATCPFLVGCEVWTRRRPEEEAKAEEELPLSDWIHRYGRDNFPPANFTPFFEAESGSSGYEITPISTFSPIGPP